jgi:tetratricopeptide (TPR) repeat protein
MRLHTSTLLLATALSLAPFDCSLANGGGSMPSSGSTGTTEPIERSPEDMAKSAYNSGVRTIKSAKEYEGDAAKTDNDAKKTKLLGKAQKAYARALEQFSEAIQQQPQMYQAWNYLGFANRHLGHYDVALAAYAKALELKPDYADAIEYRGEAYLGLNQTDAAKETYMTLFRDARPLADQLLEAMKQWLSARRAGIASEGTGVAAADLDAFSAWLEERSRVAQQTVSLAIGPAPHPWP